MEKSTVLGESQKGPCCKGKWSLPTSSLNSLKKDWIFLPWSVPNFQGSFCLVCTRNFKTHGFVLGTSKLTLQRSECWGAPTPIWGGAFLALHQELQEVMTWSTNFNLILGLVPERAICYYCEFYCCIDNVTTNNLCILSERLHQLFEGANHIALKSA